jgi:hypothetical protein
LPFVPPAYQPVAKLTAFVKRPLADSLTAGATSKGIAAVTGHRTLAEAERYTSAAEQKSLTRRAIEKQSARENETGLRSVRPGPKV